ncbi:MAG TPA: sigma-70 family RNA polymerase sigma factor [Leptolinea sp.]
MTTEEILIQRARHFEEDALAEIYDNFSPGVFRYASRLLGDVQLAEDCVADTFLRYLQAIRSNGGPQEHLQAYLYRIAHNWVTDYYRRQPPYALQLVDEIPDGSDDFRKTISNQMDEKHVRGAILQLTPDQRQVIVLKYLEGFDNERVALSMNKPVGAVKALQHRALDALRRLLIPVMEVKYE